MNNRSFNVLYIASMCSLLLFLCCGFGGLDGCFNTSPNNSGGGFPISSTDTIGYGFGGVILPHPGAQITGSWLSDDSGATGSVKYFAPITTDLNGLGYVTGGRYFADWQSTVRWNQLCVQDTTKTQYFFDVSPVEGIAWTCNESPSSMASPPSSHFALQGSLPATITAYAFAPTPLSPSAPTTLYVYDRTGSLVNTLSATNISSNGSSATFPFPTGSNGSALLPDIYGLSMVQNSSTVDGIDWVAIGSRDTTYSQPFGVAAVGGTIQTNQCTTVGRTKQCTPGSGTYYFPVITSYANNQVAIDGALVTVGVHPTTVLVFANGSYSTRTTNGDVTTTTTWTGPTRGLVTNCGSNSVSIVDVNRDSVVATIGVGISPVAAAISPDQTTAYVANYGSGTVSVINLSTLQVTSTLTVGANPLSVALDNQGNLWVGNTGSMSRVVLSSGAVANTVSMPGPVTSMAYSNAQNELIVTSVQSGGTIQANAYPYSNISSSSTTPSPLISRAAGYSADYVAASSGLTGIPSPEALAAATLVSNDSHNSLTVSATSTGFVVTDLTTALDVMEGNTPGPVRSIAVDQQNQVAYLTVPSQNLVITLPLPHVTLQ